jgi:hypothetical protein
MPTKLVFRFDPIDKSPDQGQLDLVAAVPGVRVIDRSTYMIALEGEPEVLMACAKLLGDDWDSHELSDATFSLPAPPFAHVVYHPDATPETIAHHKLTIEHWPAPPPIPDGAVPVTCREPEPDHET